MENTNSVGKEAIEAFTKLYADWSYTADRLQADFTLVSFAAAMKVVNAVAEEADRMDHHPWWSNVYNKLSFSLCTHSAEDKVTELDIVLAKRISEIVAKYTK